MAQLMPNTKVNPGKSVQASNSTASTTTTTASSKVESKESSKFGSVYNQVIASSNKSATQTTETASEGSIDVEQLGQVLNAQSVEELLDLLNISHDEGLLMVQVGDEGKALAIDEMLNFEDLMVALNIDAEQLLQTINQLLGEEKQVSDLWELLSLVQENAPLLLSQITSSLQGEQKVTPKESQQLLQVLKLAELVGKQSDLTLPQETKLADMKNFLSQALTQLQMKTETTTATTTAAGKITLPGFQQVTQQIVTKQQDTSGNEVVSQNTTVTKAETITITLPASKPAQSEAFIKEMQAILNKTQVSNAAGIMKLSIKLYPENLGSIRIELVQQNGVLTARLLATTALGRELLDNNAHQLKQAFIQQNIQVDRLDIAQSLQDADRNSRDQNFFNSFFKQQQQEEQETTSNEDEDAEKMSFSEFLINEEV